MVTFIDGVKVIYTGEPVENELAAYVARGIEKYGTTLHTITVNIVGDEVELEYDYSKKFHRLRRITGYLVGTVDRWNNGKRAELNDRVKHG